MFKSTSKSDSVLVSEQLSSIETGLAQGETSVETNESSELHFLSGIPQLLSRQTSSSSSMVKIIDIQKGKRKSGSSPSHDNISNNDDNNNNYNNRQQNLQQSWSHQQRASSATSPEHSKWSATTSNIIITTTTNTNNQQQQQQQPRTGSSADHKQPSGETLSSFESDYDLLVYLGETETEDIVDTERSLDYQDQTWRQSICGGASLAPTIDDSLNGEFLSGTSLSSATQQHHRNHARDDDDFDLLNTPTPTAATFGSGSPFFTPPTVASSIGGRQSTSISTRAAQSSALLGATPADNESSHLRRADELNLESDDCDNEVSLVFHKQSDWQNNSRQVRPVARIVQRISQNPHLAADGRPVKQIESKPGSPIEHQKSSTSAGNKLGYLFSRRPEKSHPNDDVPRRGAELEIGWPTEESDRHADDHNVATQSSYPQQQTEQTMPESTGGGRSNNDGDATELDRLLAEMNESLDLKSLARYDPMPTRYPATTQYEQRQHNQQRSQTLNHRIGSSQQQQPYNSTQAPLIRQQQLMTSNNASQSSRSLSLASVKQSETNQNDGPQRLANNASQQRQQNLVAESESSILDEYDGASRMLEQMISDQLVRDPRSEPKRHQRRQQVEQKPSPCKSQVLARPGEPAAVVSNKPSSSAVDDCFPDNREISRSIDNESPSKTVSSTRKVSTCSSSVATETSVVLATPRGVNQSAKISAARDCEPLPAKVDLEQRVGSSKWPNRGLNMDVVRQRGSFEHDSPLNSGHSRGFSNSKLPQTCHSFDLADHAAHKTRKSSKNNNSSADERPPTPPEVDYNKDSSTIIMHEVDLEGGKVIQLEAAEFPQDEISSEPDKFLESKPPNETQMDKMKRRTLSSMRSMRNKFNDFLAVNRANTNQNEGTQQAGNQKHNHQAIKLISDDAVRSQAQQRAPQPPKRSSSTGSQGSNSHQSRGTSQNRRSRLDRETKEVIEATEEQQRQSRSRAPREKQRQQKQSFGQQIRERLSRSKSRFTKFLKPSSTRAQSTPNIKENKLSDPKVDDSELFQPGDIARNSGGENLQTAIKRDSFDESLDRHLAASLDLADRQKAQPASSSSSSSDLSGLDTTKTKSRSRPRSRTKRAGNQSDRERSKDKRPSSLISLRRLGSFRSKKQSPPIEDLDSMQLKTSSEIPTAANRKRSRKNHKTQTKSPSGAPDNSSGGEVGISPVNKQRVSAKTDDYFGGVAPLQVSSDEKLAVRTSANEPDDHHGAIAKESITLQLPKINRGNRSPSAKSWVCEDPTRIKIRGIVRPNRSQSMRSISGEKGPPSNAGTSNNLKLDSANRTVSFSNLQQRQQQRRLPLSVNTFRPSSACAHIEPETQGDQAVSNRMNETRAESVVTPTPIGLSSDPLVGRRLESTKPPQLEHHQSRLTPIRARGAAMIDDIKHKCSELFSPSDHSATHRSRGRQSRNTAASVPPSRSPEPPVRPPRKRGLHQRSKSVSARPAAPVERSDVEKPPQVVATPGSSLDRGHTAISQRTEKSEQVHKKLASFAQQPSRSTVDSPVAGGLPASDSKSSSKSPPRASVVPTGDLREWKPVIKSNSRTASGRAFRALGAKDGQNVEQTKIHSVDDCGRAIGMCDGMAVAQKQEQSSPDSDSTWESTTGDDEDAQPQVLAHKNDTPLIGKIVNDQTKPDHLVDDESSLARLRVVNEPNTNVKRHQMQQPATACRTGTADDEEQARGGNNRLSSSAVSHKFGDKEQDGNNNNSRAHKDLLHSSERNQQQEQRHRAEIEFKLKHAHDCDAVVSEDDLKFIRKPCLKQQQTTEAESVVISEGISGGSKIDENCEHERNIEANDRSVHRQEQQPTVSSGLSNRSTKIIIHSDPKPFKFNANLPSPSQLLQEGKKSPESKLIAAQSKDQSTGKQKHSLDENLEGDKMVRVALRPQQQSQKQSSTQQHSEHSRFMQEAQVRNTSQDNRERPNEADSENRLSIYENVSESNAVSGAAAQSPTNATITSVNRRQWRRPEKAPHVPAKPAHLVPAPGCDLIGAISERIQPPAPFPVEQQPKKSSSSDDNWSTDDVVPEKTPPKTCHGDERNNQTAAQQQKQPAETARRSERKLVTMTSIIHDPIDDLMEARPSGRISSTSQSTGNDSNGNSLQQARISGASSLQRRDSNFGTDNEHVDSDDTDSSFAAATASRQRLVRKFEQKGCLPRPEASRAKFPAFNEGKSAASFSGRGDSLVKRLARNFDSTAQEQPASSSGRPPVVPPKNVSHTITTATTIMKSFDDDSAADWSDARNADLILDEKEIAEFLQDFDNKPSNQNQSPAISFSANASENISNQPKRPATSNTTVTLTEIPAQEASEACDSVSTGADPYVTVADSTLNDDDDDGDANDDDDEDENHLNGYAEQRPRHQAAPATGTTSDDDTLNDEELKDEDDDDEINSDMLENQAQLILEDEEDLTDSYTSARGTLPRASDESTRQQQQQHQQQGKDSRTSASCPASVASANARSSCSRADIKSRYISACERDDELSARSLRISASRVLRPNIGAPAPVYDNPLASTLNLADPEVPSVPKAQKESLSDNHSNDNIKVADSTTTNTRSASSPSGRKSSAKTQRPESIVAQPDEGDEHKRGTNLIDDHFKNSLNHIIARRSSSALSLATGQVTNNLGDNNDTQIQQQMSTSSADSRKATKKSVDKEKKNKKKKNKSKSSSSHELRGLSKLYRALLGSKHQKQDKSAKRTGDNKETSENYSHSSSSSVCSSSDESSTTVSSDSENEDDDESLNDKKLVEAAKKCSQIYEELERILERRLAKENHRPTGGGKSGMKQESQLANKGRPELGDDGDEDQAKRLIMEDDEAADDMGYEESLSTMMVESGGGGGGGSSSSSSGGQQQQSQTGGGSVEDRVSLSSSSVSSESIPEIRQRKNLQKLYHVVNEICSSEARFVDTLRLLNVDFRQHIMGSSMSHSSTSSTNVIPQDRLNSMLKHLPQLQALNENLLAELEQARSEWPRSQKIAHVLVKIGPFLKHYSTYIREFESMQQQYNENLKKYPHFAERVREFESSDRSRKLSVQHHILKPIQRIPQYRLLLQQYLHNLKPDDVDYEDTVNALEVVSRVAEHANHSMSEGVNFAKLLALQAKIVGKQRDIVQPGRTFIKEGELMKVCRKQIQPRWFVLLNDALLYLTQVQSSDILFLKNELPLDGCLVSVANELGEQNKPPSSGNHDRKQEHKPDHHRELDETSKLQSDKEFSVSTRTRSFALIAKNRAERDEWVSVLRKTVEEYMAKRRSFISSIHRQHRDENEPLSAEKEPRPLSFSSTSTSSSNQQSRMIEEPQQQYLLGQMAPIWTPDSRVSMCQLCTSSFSALFRRHHCRACGRVVCSACSSNKAPLIYLKCRAARVCDECFDTLKANIHLYYLPPNSNRGGVSSLSERLASSGMEPLIGEQELRRLDEHFRNLLKSQFTRTKSLNKLAASGGGKRMKKKTKSSLLPSAVSGNKPGENIVIAVAKHPVDEPTTANK